MYMSSRTFKYCILVSVFLVAVQTGVVFCYFIFENINVFKDPYIVRNCVKKK